MLIRDTTGRIHKSLEITAANRLDAPRRTPEGATNHCI
jgi:hypothetical protein